MSIEQFQQFSRGACRVALVAIVACTLAQAAHAQLLAYEGFDYEAGGLIDVGGGTLGSGIGWATEGFNTGGSSIPGAEGKFNGWYYECHPGPCGVGPDYRPLGVAVEAAPAEWGYTDSQGNKLPTSGGRIEVNNWEQYVRQLDLSGLDPSLVEDPTGENGFHKLGVEDTSMWISFLGEGTEIQSAAALGLGGTNDTDYSGYDRHVALGRIDQLHEDGTKGVAVGDPPSVPLAERNRAWGASFSGASTNNFRATGDSYNEKVFYVARVRFGAGFSNPGLDIFDEILDVWINPDLGGTAPAEGDRAISDFEVWDFNFNAIKFTGNADTYFDEIRIGLTYADVAPIAVPGGDADFDVDGDVDGADFIALQRGFGGPYSATDFANWNSEFGTVSAVSAAAAIPEPSALMLASILTMTSIGCRRRYR